MSEAKIEIKIGAISFNGEGDSAWLEKQLDKILNKAEDLVKLAPQSVKINPPKAKPNPADFSEYPDIKSKALATFLKDKNATSNQVEKFLATSIWLEAKGKSRLTTSDVSKALKENSQSKLTNASDTLNGNVKKGFCEKDGNDFFVTQEGKEHLSI